jgi:hypothetical protein
MPLLANQWNSLNYKDTSRQRIYLKDIDCPDVWHENLKKLLPPSLFFLNDSSGIAEDVGAALEPNPYGQSVRIGKGIAKAGDLMSNLPSEMRAENLMCYIGHEGTYTPCHREMCASLGHNIMVEASNGLLEHGKSTKPGSSIWFMTESKDRHLVSEYWASVLGHDIEIEDHFAQINAWKAAPFKTYVIEQKVGDFILIPPLAAHQVWNRGTRTMKIAWNRITAETLEMALDEALPRARMVCRDEEYKNKAIIFFSLDKYSKLLYHAQEQVLNKSERIRQLQKDFRRLFLLYSKILCTESFSKDQPEEGNIQFLPFDSNVTCSYCRCNIFNRFFTCPSCVDRLPFGEEDCYDICMDCYAMGRSCACISGMKWVEQFRWKELTEKHMLWRQQILKSNFRLSNHYQSLSAERENLGKRTLAEICQHELKRRPWVDVNAPVSSRKSESVDDVDDVKTRNRRKVHRTDKWRKGHGTCHICKTPDPMWKLASCTSCDLNYCYGSLFRAFDIMPQTVMEEYLWKCPKCLKICSCGACRRDHTMTPYEPKGTLLGHDTKKIADPRSVESLVDFSVSNIRWLKKPSGDHFNDTRPIKRHQKEAEETKLNVLLSNNEPPTLRSFGSGVLQDAAYEDIPIDPALSLSGSIVNQSLGASQDHVSLNSMLVSRPDTEQLRLSVPSEVGEHGTTRAITFEYLDQGGSAFSVLLAEQAGSTVDNLFPRPASLKNEQCWAIRKGDRQNTQTDSRNGVRVTCNRLVFTQPERLSLGENHHLRKKLIVRIKMDKKRLETLEPSHKEPLPGKTKRPKTRP